MYAHYSIKYFDSDINTKEDTGVAFGEDECDIFRNLKHYYEDIGEITLWFDENYDCNVVPTDYFNVDKDSCI